MIHACGTPSSSELVTPRHKFRRQAVLTVLAFQCDDVPGLVAVVSNKIVISVWMVEMNVRP